MFYAYQSIQDLHTLQNLRNYTRRGKFSKFVVNGTGDGEDAVTSDAVVATDSTTKLPRVDIQGSGWPFTALSDSFRWGGDVEMRRSRSFGWFIVSSSWEEDW